MDAQLPDAKDELEAEVLARFITEIKKRKEISLEFVSDPIQNKENDLDFVIDTSEGKRWIELMEIAPLEQRKGGYEFAESTRNSYRDAEWAFNKLKGKSDKYADTASKTILLMYITEGKFALSSTAISILQN